MLGRDGGGVAGERGGGGGFGFANKRLTMSKVHRCVKQMHTW